jgi:excisionase family DNA binding protein
MDNLTPAEAAAILRVDPASVRRWVRMGKLAGFQLGGPGGPLRLRRADVLAFMRPVVVVDVPALQTRAEHEAGVEADRALLRSVGCV